MKKGLSFLQGGYQPILPLPTSFQGFELLVPIAERPLGWLLYLSCITFSCTVVNAVHVDFYLSLRIGS